jgi:hypothetical protein
MLKLYVVVRVYLLVRKGRMIDAIRLVRSKLGHMRGNYYGMQYGQPLGSLKHIRNAKDFVTDIRDGRWPETI